ncbi:MAG: polysaccharide deacetylase family protein [Terracidiphilus sp.]
MATGISAGLPVAAALGVAAGGYAYAAMSPGSQLFGRTLTAPRNVAGRPGELALTFDDGPNPACTPRLLDILAQHDVRATFFLIGSFAQQQPGLVRRILAAGHLIGNHSWSHPNLALTSARRVDEELTRTRDTLRQLAGVPIRYFRPPYGARRPHVLRAARQLGMESVTWNAMTTDWSEPSADNIAGRLIRKIDHLHQKGRAANIVLHDGGHRGLGTNRTPSINAAAQLLARYKLTHRFVTLEEWSRPYPEATTCSS